MLFLLYLVVQVLARLVGAKAQDEGSKDLEILVLRPGCSGGRPALRSSGPVTGCSSRWQAGRSHGSAGQASWSPRRRSSPGIASL